MKTRIITAVVLLCIFIPVLWFSDTIVFPAAVGIISLVGAYEYLKCVGYGKKPVVYIPACIMCALLPFCAHYSSGVIYLLITVAICAIYMFYLFAYAVFCRGRERFSDVAGVWAGVFYILLAFVCLVVIRREQNGEYLYLLTFIGAWVTDTFAYFTGFIFGKHKLIEEISPKKTVEGAIGGIIFCIAAFLLFGYIIGGKIDATPNYLMLGVTAFFVSVISQIGDLVFSLIKREHGVKDYGKIFPGHGGVLDRFDSVIPVCIVVLIMMIIMTLGEGLSFFA